MTGEHLRDPWTRYKVPVAGGELEVARAGAAAEEADGIVLAAHGVTSSLEVWRTIARELNGRARVALLAPDLRGRGRSADLPAPYGIAAHVADLVAVLDHAGVGRAVLAGHSMGAYVATALAAEHPGRVAGVVLLDAGLVVHPPADDDPDELLEVTLEAALARLDMTFSSADEYAGLWHSHPAFARDWNDDVDAYARYDLGGVPGAMHCVVSPAAVRADSADLVHDETLVTAIDRVRAPIHLLHAPRGMFDDEPLLPAPILDAFRATHPDARLEKVPDVNHYTLAMGAGAGPRRVADALVAAVRGVPTA
jgi:pimeloyl-ACP methyl ester carboxylesterase